MSCVCSITGIVAVAGLAIGCGPAPAPTAAGPLSVAATLTQARAADGSYISWREHLIDDESVNGGLPLRGGDGFQIADLDRDGFEDIVSVHEDNDYIRIAFGTGDPDRWTLVTLAEGDQAPAPEDVSIADADGDGWLDVVAACELAHLIYFQNPADPERIRSGDWPRAIPSITRERGSWIRVFFADLDGDGKPEIAAPNKGDQLPAGEGRPAAFVEKEVSWFRLPPDPLDGESWREHVLTRIKIPMNAQPADLDADGDLDLISGSRFEARPFWFENLGGKPLRFTEHAIEVEGRHEPPKFGGKRLTAMNVVVHDVNRDGRVDLLMQETPFLAVWLEQPVDFSDPWRIHKIGDLAPDTTTGLALADIDGDGRLDLFTGGYSENPRDHDGDSITVHSRTGRLAWWSQPEDPFEEWTLHNVSRRKRGMYDAFAARDLDGDGDLDFVTTRGNSGSFDGLLWLEQVRSPESRKAFTPARVIESAHLELP